MTHQRQKIRGSQPGRSATDNIYLLSSGYICFRYSYFICRNLIHSIFFETPDVDRIIDQISPAVFFTRMFTDHSTGSRKRIVFPDHIHRSRIIFFRDESDISRNIHMCGAETDTRNLLTDLIRTASVFDMTSVFFIQRIESPENISGSLIADGAVRRVPDHFRQSFHFGRRFAVRPALQNTLKKTLQLRKTVAAGHALSAGLSCSRLQQ